MLYILGYQSLGEYLLLETNTNSLMTADVTTIQKLMKRLGTELKNAKIVDNTVVINEWTHNMSSTPVGFSKYYDRILLAQVGNDKYKLYDKLDGIIYEDSTELKTDIGMDKISNCCKENDEYK